MKNARIIAGSGRSGTTWVLDAVAASNHLRPIFEPLNRTHPRVPPHAYRYLCADADEPELFQFMESVFDGRFHSVWSDYRELPELLYPRWTRFSSLRETKNYAKRLRDFGRNVLAYRKTRSEGRIVVKMIRANLMLGWLVRNFNASVVLLLRHPCAVVESQLRQRAVYWDPYTRLRQYGEDSEFRDRFGSRYGKYLDQTLSEAAASALVWCIENQIPVEESGRFGYEVVCYESLARRSREDWSRLTRQLKLDRSPDASLLLRPSQQASNDWRPEDDSTAQWMSRISASDLKDINWILMELGVEIYKADDAFPRIPTFIQRDSPGG